MRHVAAAVLVATAALIGAGCHDTTITAPPGASSEILDGGHGSGNQHFYFLKPMVTPPATFPGTFDAMQSPTVQICQWDGTACAGTDVADFSMTAGSGSELIRVEAGNGQYIVNWHTDQSDLDVTKTYRIRVLIGTYELGHADVDPVSSGSQLKNVNTGEYVALLDGRTLPIAFRIEAGAVPLGTDVPMAAGEMHTCALDVNGKAYCWGDNYYGQLGTGSTGGPDASGGYDTPQPVQGGHTFRSIQTGVSFSCGLDMGGQLWCWGSNYDGNMGNGAATITPVLTPTLAADGQTFTSMTVGSDHICGIATDGGALCWGFNGNGQIGSGSLTPQRIATPTAVTGGHSFTQLAAGNFHTCGLTGQGETYCWGGNSDGQLGDGTAAPAYQPTPQLVVGTAAPGGHVFTALAPGVYHTCALDATGAAYCWGLNANGELGRGTTSYIEATPGPVSGGHAYAQMTSGVFYTCALGATDHVAYCWGNNTWGQLGQPEGAPGYSATPTAIPSLQFAWLTAGDTNTCGILTDGTGRCWGDNSQGQLGIGSTSFLPVSAPTAITGGLTFKTP